MIDTPVDVDWMQDVTPHKRNVHELHPVAPVLRIRTHASVRTFGFASAGFEKPSSRNQNRGQFRSSGVPKPTGAFRGGSPRNPNKALAAISLAASGRSAHAPGMFVVSEVEAVAIRAAYDRGGEFTPAMELRRLFPGIFDKDHARECAR